MDVILFIFLNVMSQIHTLGMVSDTHAHNCMHTNMQTQIHTSDTQTHTHECHISE